jgi:hypothetical protein
MAKELTIQESKELLLNPVYQTTKLFEVQQRMAQMYTSSDIVPKTFRGNIGNCVIAIDMAQRMQANPLMVMQNLYIVHGNPSWSSKFLISCINSCGRFSPLRYEFKGKEGTKDWACRAFAFEKSDTTHKEPLYGDWITMKMADDEGWATKDGSKWRTMPGQMLRYRAAAFWQRVYAPEISIGFYTKEEVEDGAFGGEDMPVMDVTPTPVEDGAPVEAVEAAPQQASPADIIQASMQKQQERTMNPAEIFKKAINDKAANAALTIAEEALASQSEPAVDAETGELFPPQNK